MKNSKKKLGIISLGCSKNQVDAEVMLGLIVEKGYEIVSKSQDAEIIIINTCGFIESAKQESIDTILEQIAYKKNGKCEKIIVTGCLAERYRDVLKKEIPEIDYIVGVSGFTNILEVIDERGNIEDPLSCWETLEANPPRLLTTIPGSAYLKIAEGCDNFCSYCAIPSIRGRFRSRGVESLLDEARTLAEKGVKELIIIAQDISKYGIDLEKGTNLTGLLKQLCTVKGIEWIRLQYCYPDGITHELLDLIAQEDKICKYLDIPLQHVNQRIISKMNRNFSSKEAKKLIQDIRQRIPGIVIRTTFIAGFPGEREEDFYELESFIQEYPFNHAGVFAYSREEGTPAADFKDQVDEDIKLQRKNALMAIQQKISKKFNGQWVDKVSRVLIEGQDSPGIFIGRHYGQSPEIDGNVYVFSSKALKPGDFVNVKMTKSYDYDLLGEHYEFAE